MEGCEHMYLSAGEKIKIILKRKGMTVGELAEKLLMSRQNLSNKFSRDNFTENDLEMMASTLGVKLEITFKFPDGTKI
jgi:transcriptional regulator with XRE-family HTH domain